MLIPNIPLYLKFLGAFTYTFVFCILMEVSRCIWVSMCISWSFWWVSLFLLLCGEKWARYAKLVNVCLCHVLYLCFAFSMASGTLFKIVTKQIIYLFFYNAMCILEIMENFQVHLVHLFQCFPKLIIFHYCVMLYNLSFCLSDLFLFFYNVIYFLYVIL